MPTPTTFSSLVFHGDKGGRTIGFPTINLDPSVIPQDTPTGVWAATVNIADKTYQGALYFGPKTHTNDASNILEIFILDFNQDIYGQKVQFSLQKFIRPVLHFTSLPELTNQLTKDIAAVRETLVRETFHDTQTKK